MRGNAIANVNTFHGKHQAAPEENAELIVRAVNSFEAMRDALKALYEHCEMVHRHWGENCNREQAEAARKAGLAALAQAEGEEPKTETLKAMEAGADRIAALRKVPAKSEIPSIKKHIAKLKRKLKRAGDPGECGDIQDALDHYREELRQAEGKAVVK